MQAMPHVERFAPGEFCWVEWAGPDQSAAKQFYSRLFGWTARDIPTGPASVYSLMQLDNAIAAGLYAPTPSEIAAGLPSHWQLYVAVQNVDQTADKASALGGRVAEVFDVTDRGRGALIQDPTGAFLSLWQPNKRSGLGVVEDPGTFCWADLITPNEALAKTFYESLFGWKLTFGEGKDSGYLHIVNGEKFIGGIASGEHASGPPHWRAYFAVADVGDSIQRAANLGAKTLFGPVGIQGQGRFAVLADPQGAVFAVHQSGNA